MALPSFICIFQITILNGFNIKGYLFVGERAVLLIGNTYPFKTVLPTVRCVTAQGRTVKRAFDTRGPLPGKGGSFRYRKDFCRNRSLCRQRPPCCHILLSRGESFPGERNDGSMVWKLQDLSKTQEQGCYEKMKVVYTADLRGHTSLYEERFIYP
jgi:hypothetical protein